MKNEIDEAELRQSTIPEDFKWLFDLVNLPSELNEKRKIV